MKFNSVEISGFRIFNKPEDANFNFITEDGETADFVSLFAPNGFGKTSFYDAVEWAVTNNIERFWVNSNHTKNSLTMLRQLNPEQIRLLKNRNTENESWVKIVNSENKEYINRILKVPGQKHYDIYEDGIGRENIDFLNVILSQEWISRFLKEADGKSRYKKFMESNPELSEIDVYYQNVIALSGANDNKMVALENEIKEFQNRISYNLEKDLLSKVNEQILNVNKFEKNDTLNEIDIAATQEEISDFQNALTDIIADDSEIKRLEKLLTYIQLAQNGNTDFLSFKQYFEELRKLTDTYGRKKIINENLLDFKKLRATTNEIAQKEKSKAEISIQLKALQETEKSIPFYSDTLSKIAAKNEIKNQHQQILEKLRSDIEESNRKLIEIEGASKKFERQRLEVNEQLEKIPELKRNHEALLKSTESLRGKIELQFKKTSDALTDYSKIEEGVEELKKVIWEFDSGQYSETSLNKNKEQIQNLKQIETLEAQRLQLKKEIQSINQLIDAQESLNKTLSEFIASGLAIVNKQETDTCPLCSQTYDNHQALTDRILNNNSLTESIKALLEGRSNKQIEIDENVATVNKLSENIKQFYFKKLNDLQNQLRVAKELKETEQSVLDELAKQLNLENKRLKDLKSNLQEDSIDAYEIKLKADLADIQASKTSGDIEVKRKKEAHEKLESNKNEFSEIIELLNSETKDLRSNKDYNKVVLWLNDNDQGIATVAEFVKSKIRTTMDQSDELDEVLKSLKRDLDELKEQLKKLNEEQLKLELEEVEKKILELESHIAAYESHLKNNLQITPNGLTRETLNKSLNTKESETKERLKKEENYRIEINKLKGYSETILPYLQSEQAKVELAKAKEELIFLKQKVSQSLKTEIEKTKNHLDQKIKGFFYEDLINEIYGKIDPHPRFKNVNFIATFTDDNPSLDVCVKGGTEDDDKDSLIPNLYFSTAQINILSLSIFLASALNSKTYDCIFIDDPIQSMDSINVLSTIDLLRSIVVNNKKQIILSTHDENFHNLLKMKIPPTLFKSKFLELESFGKLKKESVF
jgi:exonuclease SbcC